MVWNKALRKLNDIWLWFAYRFVPRYRFHVLSSGLPPGWHQFEDVILHAAFSRFAMEWPETRKWPATSREEIAVLDPLYEWWTKGRRIKHEMYRLLDEEHCKKIPKGNGYMKRWNEYVDAHPEYMEEAEKLMELEEYLYKEDTEKLLVLIANRRSVSW